MPGAPITFRWDGEAMVPLPRFVRQADRDFVIGETYTLVQQEERSAASHRHYFAAVHDAWANLPEAEAERFPTAEHLRRYALIKAGFCDTHTLVASSAAEARRLAAFIKPTDEFAVVTVEGATVTRYVAKSQSMRAMGKQDFQRSKDAVLEIVSGKIGVRPADLERAVA